MNNQITYLFTLLGFMSIQIKAQDIKPLSGKLVMIAKKEVTNKQAIDSSLAARVPLVLEIFQDVLLEKSKNGEIEKDSLEIAEIIQFQIKPMFEMSVDPRNTVGMEQKYSYIFKGDLIEYQIENSVGENNKEMTRIDRKDGKKTYFIKRDSTFVENKLMISMSAPDEYTEMEIEEISDITKDIFGYKCHKIIVTKKKNLLEIVDPFDMFSISKKTYEKYKDNLGVTEVQEMYVTDQIKCMYHPRISDSIILKKYYPLEIIEKDGIIEGSQMEFVTKQLILN